MLLMEIKKEENIMNKNYKKQHKVTKKTNRRR